MRFTLIGKPDGNYDLVMTTHHILVDGWSMPLILKDLVVLYATHGDGSMLPPVRSYRDFLEWLSERDADASLEAWAGSLEGAEDPTLLASADRGRSQSVMPDVVQLELAADRTAELSALARDLGVT